MSRVKKSISVGVIFLIFIIMFLLQSNFFNNFMIAGIKPNIIVILILFIGLYAGRKAGVILGFILGILLDSFNSNLIGISAIMFMIVGFLGGYFDNNFDKEIKASMILMVIGSTAIYEIGRYVFLIIFNNSAIEIPSFIRILVVEIVYNIILTIIIYPVLKKGGYLLEKIYKTKQVLTRYF